MPETSGGSNTIIAKAGGYLAAWAIMTLALTLASRSIRLGPGFADPLPYAAAAIAMNLAGRGLRKWLGQSHSRSEDAISPSGFFRRQFSTVRSGFGLFLRDTSAFNNFILLSVAYFLGVGFSALCVRLPRLFAKGSPPSPETFWIDAEIGSQPKDAYYRPY